MNNPVLYAAAYVLLMGQPTAPPVPSPTFDPVKIECQLPAPPIHDTTNGHVSVRWVARHHHARRGHHWRHRHHR